MQGLSLEEPFRRRNGVVTRLDDPGPGTEGETESLGILGGPNGHGAGTTPDHRPRGSDMWQPTGLLTHTRVVDKSYHDDAGI
jgi:hypothetical protein